ncbi:Nibrin-like protein [Drosera capensis]
MVWGLFPLDARSGDDKYYIFSQGTYKVGRKGCDVIINKEKGVSRVHAEMLIDSMACLGSIENRSSGIKSYARIRDCSKYGTFIVHDGDSKIKVHECPSKEATVQDGDLISFGTGNATYRNFKASAVTRLIQEKVSSIGAQLTHKWSTDCTHVIVDQNTPVNEDLLDAIVTEKPFARYEWLEVLANSKIQSGVQSCSSYVPSLMLDGVSIVLADVRTRRSCLKEYKFMLESLEMYKFGNKLPSLVEAGGTKFLFTETFDSSNQDLGGNLVHVIPAGSADNEQNRGFLLKIDEVDLVRAVIAGHLDRSVLISPSIVISSSCSTEGTVVADSDAETESAASYGAPAEITIERAKCQIQDELPQQEAAPLSVEKGLAANAREGYSTSMVEEQDNCPAVPDYERKASDDVSGPSSRNDQYENFVRRNTGATSMEMESNSESANQDIHYIRNFIVRRVNPPTSTASAADVINFKRFRKTAIESGNSFNNLIPFAKDPYSESAYENKEVNDLVQEEKRRKQTEAISEDLFNHEKLMQGRNRGAGAGRSLSALLTSR